MTALTVKSDQESSVNTLANEIAKKRTHRTMKEKAPKHDHKANGFIENVVKRVESLTMTYAAVVSDKCKGKIGSTSLILPWIVRHSAFIISRFAIGADGQTPWERVRGRSFSSDLVEMARRST